MNFERLIMKKELIVGLLAAILGGGSLAAPALAHQGEKHAAVPQTAEGQGVVRAVSARDGTVTVAHEPIPALGWPAMTMAFRVRSADMLNGLSVGARVHFVLANDNGRPVVTEIHVR
jgi:Cu(I)/Ag(I) efflux system protein CusF